MTIALQKTYCFCALLIVLGGVSPAYAQQTPSNSVNDAGANEDTLLFNNGEKLIGHLERVVGTDVVFKSDMAGEIKVDLSKIKELHSSQKFAVIGKDTMLHKHENPSAIPQGPITVANEQVAVSATPQTPARTVPVAATGYIVNESTFKKNLLTRPGLLEDWKGSATAGVSLVLATQKNRTVTSAVSLVRTIPTEDWMDPQNRTAVNFNSAFGSLSQPNSPTLKTSLYHADIEQDEYFSRTFYYFGSGAWDHNISQGLDLQQTYGAGFGWTAVKDAIQELNLKASLDYINQRFNPLLELEATGAAPIGALQQPYSNSLVGSVFGESYHRTFPKKIVLTEALTITPSWNNLSAYSGNAAVNLTLPIYKNLGITIGSIDTFLNDPPPGFKKNSFQLSVGATYTLP